MDSQDNHAPQAKPSLAPKKITIYYDGVCNLCSGVMGAIDATAKGNSINGIDASSGVLPTGVSMYDAMRDVHAVDSSGAIHKGIDAVFLVFDQYPRLKYLATLGRLPGMYLLARAMYRMVEKTRYYIWGRKK